MLQSPVPRTFTPATRTRYSVPFSVVRVSAVVDGSLTVSVWVIPALPTSYSTSQDLMVSVVIGSTEGG